MTAIKSTHFILKLLSDFNDEFSKSYVEKNILKKGERGFRILDLKLEKDDLVF